MEGVISNPTRNQTLLLVAVTTGLFIIASSALHHYTTGWIDPVALLVTGGAALEALVESATGWLGLVIIFGYSFLIAFALPGPSEIVLIAPLEFGLPPWVHLSTIMLVSATGKAAGSVFAFHIGQEIKQSGPIVRWLRQSRWNVLEWSEKRSAQFAQQYGYAGLAMAPSVPFFPDVVSTANYLSW